jgi:hypothetical protein
MSDEHPQQDSPEGPPRRPEPPTMLVPRSYIFLTIFVVVLSIVVTLFMRNPYTQAISGDYYERTSLDSSILWAIIFIGLPGLWFTYQKWVLPWLKKRR